MNYAIVITRVDPKTKKEAMATAESLGMPLSAIIKAFLKQFIRTKSVFFSADSETPSAHLLESLRKSEEDVKAGRVISFKTGQDVLDYLDKEIKNDKQNKQSSY